ncbi:MAG: DUF86 domain-containing protein [Nanoarchaeota archaeon]
MKERINEKIEEIEEYISHIIDFTPEKLEDYKKDLKTKAACEHYFEKTIEACEDLAFLILRLNELKFPDKDESVFYTLFNHNLISKELFNRFKDAKGMRNFISHEYGKIDDDLVFQALSEELEKDVKEFIESVNKCLLGAT